MNKQISVGSFLKNYGIIVVMIILLGIFAAFRISFIYPDNLFEILKQVSIMGIIAVGMTYCMLAGGIDLSVGSNVAFGMSITAMFMAAMPIPLIGGFNINPVVGSLIGIVATTAVGFLNGFLVTKFKIPALIVTLGMMQVIRGVVYVMTGAMPIYKGFEEYFRFVGQGSLWIIPIPVLVMAAAVVIGWIILSKTVFGRYVYCVGGNPEVARLSGINVKKVQYSVFAISGFLCGIAAIVLLSRMNSCQPRAGTGYEFEVITACVLGGVSIAGGEGKIRGVLFGVLIMGILFSGLIQVGISEFYQQIIKGTVLLIAVGIDTMSRYKKQKFIKAQLNIPGKGSSKPLPQE